MGCLLADVEIRKQTGNRAGLQQARAASSHPRIFKLGDEATGTKSVSALLDRHFYNAEAVSLDRLWKELGVALVGDRIVLDDSAPQAKWRKMIVMGPPGQAPKHVKLPWES